MDKQDILNKLYQELESKENLPLRSKAEDIIPGEGNPEARVLFIGEAGGFHEARLRRPFVGAAGALLNKSLERIGLKREDVYITNVVKARPPENRDPTFAEISAYKVYLDREIAVIGPELIVTLGRYSMGRFLPGKKITEVHGRLLRIGELLVMPMFHPAAALRSPEVLRSFETDFDTLGSYLKNRENVEVINEQKKEKNQDQIGLF